MKSILLKGACDVEALNFYLKKRREITFCKEGVIHTEKHGDFYCTANTEILLNLRKTFNSKFIDNAFYKTILLNKHFDVIVLSTITEYCYGIYQNKFNDIKIIYGENKHNCFTDGEFYQNGNLFFGFQELNSSDYTDLEKEWKYLGINNIDNVIENYRKIVSLYGRNSDIVFLLGPVIHDELEETSRPFVDSEYFFEELNKRLISEFSYCKNVKFIDPNIHLRKHLKSEYFFYNSQSFVHYKRKVYYCMAKDLHKFYPDIVKATYSNERKRRIKKIIKKLLRK